MTQGQGSDPQLAALVAESRAMASAAIAEMAEIRQELEQAAAEQRAEREAAEAKRAERARAGELGPELRRLQQRIDLGQTSWGAVLRGADDSPEAAAARTSLRTNMDVFATGVDAAMKDERDAGRPDPRAELAASFAELRALVAENETLQRDGGTNGR